MLQLADIVFKFSDSNLFEQLSFTVHPGHRVGLVGRNGVGKSTVFNLIRKELQPEDGKVQFPKKWKLAWLNQNIPPSTRSAIDFVVDGHHLLRKVQHQIAIAESSGDGLELANALSSYDDMHGYQIESEAAKVLHGLGFSERDFSKAHRDFSGGWRIRLNLAQTLMTPSDLMLLDEPTNHLDLEATVWLQSWLERFDGTLICVSHDREFLDRTVQEIVHIEHLKAWEYKGNFTSFEHQQSQQINHESTLFERQEKERQRIEKFVNRFRAKESKRKQVQSRMKMLERMQLRPPLRAQSPYRISINSPRKQDNPMVVMDDLTLGYDGTPVLSSIQQRVYPRNRIGVLGANGAGKSTLLKALSGELSPLAGTLRLGDHTKVGYFAQHQLELLDGDLSPYANLLAQEQMSDQSARNFLGGWGFRGDDIFRPTRQFSGGEKARLVLALMCRQNNALLLLDEPTNHLDIEMRDELTLALQEFEGAMLIVAHDKHMLRSSVDEFWLVRDSTVSLFEGDLDDYESLIREDNVNKERNLKKRQSQKELRQLRAKARNAVKDLTDRRKEIESILDAHQSEQKSLTDKLIDPTLLAELDGNEIQKFAKRHAYLKNQIKDLESEWSSLVDRLEAHT